MESMSSSSSCYSSFEISASEKHDVFLSYKVGDTGDTFASHLRTALQNRNIKTFCIDRGDDIPEKESEILSGEVFKAIEESRLSVIIFSEGYAFSTRCLEDLAHIVKCMDKNGLTVVPIFYNIDPLDVRNQRWSYAIAFSKHGERFEHEMDKVRLWREALAMAGELSGWIVPAHRSEFKLIEEIVEYIARKFNLTLSSDNFKGLVGIERRIEEIEKLICIGSHDIRVVGIWGMGGIGKTTLAEAVYDRLSSQFEDCYFLANVREESYRYGLASLQRELLAKLFKDKDPTAGDTIIEKETNQSKKVLLVLDDVNDSNQFEVLVREKYNWFGIGSTIIVTTRDAQLLRNIAADEVCKLEELNYNEALRLFYMNAFRNNSPPTDHFEMSKRIVEYSHGMPLAIKILGSCLCFKSKSEWESVITKLRIIPNIKVQKMLGISYDLLDYQEKEAFLDIACFLRGEERDFVEQVLSPRIIDQLIDKGLVINNHSQRLWMHELVQEMGWEIVRQESIKEPGKSRLRNFQDVKHVLRVNTGTAAIGGRSLETSEFIEEMEHSPTVFKPMYNLRFLKIDSYVDNTEMRNVHLPEGLQSLPNSLKYLWWDGYPLECFSSKFTPENLMGLVITNSHMVQLWDSVGHLRNLKFLDLSNSEWLTKIPDLYDQAPNLESIHLQFCTRLVRVPSSLQYLDKLIVLNVRGCSSITEFPMLPRNIRNLDFACTAIAEVPSSINHLSHLETFYLDMCKNLKFLPRSFSSLKSLKQLSICYCTKLEYLPELPLYLENLNAKGCTSLETVSRSRIAFTQGQDDYFFQLSIGRYDFLNCLKLDQNAQVIILDEAQLRLLKTATSSWKDKKGRMSEIWCPGGDIPNWFTCQSEVSSIEIPLPPIWCSSTFLGFAICVVVDFKDCYIDGNFKLYLQVHPIIDIHPHEAMDETLIFNWKNEIDGSNHHIIVDSEHVFLFNYCDMNHFAHKYDDITAASFEFYSNNSGCSVKKCGVQPLYTKDVEKILSAAQHAGFIEVEDVAAFLKDVALRHEPAIASGSLNVQATHAKKEAAVKRFHEIVVKSSATEEEEEEEEEVDRLFDLVDGTITEDSGKSSEIEREEEEEDPTSDYEFCNPSNGPSESRGSLDVHEGASYTESDVKKEEYGNLNPIKDNRKTEPSHSCSCLMFLSLVVDILKHVLGRQSGIDKDLHREEQLQAPDEVLHSIMKELAEHNRQISQHLQTVMPTTSLVSFDPLETTSTSAFAPSQSTSAEKKPHDTPEEITDSLCSQIIELRDQNNEILQNLQTLVPATPDDVISGLFPKSTSPLSASSASNLLKDVIVDEQHVEVPQQVIHTLQSHLTELQGHNQQMLQFLHMAISNSPTTMASREMEAGKGKSFECKSMKEVEEEEEKDDDDSGVGFVGDDVTMKDEGKDDDDSGVGFVGDDVTMMLRKKSRTMTTSGGTVPASSTKRREGYSSAGKSTRPSCLVDNCSVDLTDSKPYFRRHKTCEFHAKATVVRVNGLEQRFCQQCSRFHGLSEFDDIKRSCRRRLAGHNERRRKSSPNLHREGSNLP